MITLYISLPYKHYYMLFITLLPIVFYMVMSLKRLKTVGMAIGLLLIGQLLYISVPKISQDLNNAVQTISAHGENGPRAAPFREYAELASKIPENDRGYVAGYDIPAYFWLETGLDCCYSFFVLQDSHGSYDKRVYDEISEQFTSGKAKWLLAVENIRNEMVNNYLLDNYIPVTEAEGIILYRKNLD